MHKQLDDWFLQYNTLTVQGRKKGLFGSALKKTVKPLKKGTALTNLRAAACKHTEVMIKIPKRRSGNSKGMQGIRNHLDYISRNGKTEVETNFGEKLKNKTDLKKHLDTWRDTFGIADKTKHREALNIVLSMPAGTPPQAVKNAAREFAAEQFAGHEYAFALHTDTDNPNEPAHPHVHLCVLMRDQWGERINPRKNDLFQWRIRFAEKLRDEGIQCAATRRHHRGKTTKAHNGTVLSIDKRLAAQNRQHPEKYPPYSHITAIGLNALRDAVKTGRRPENPYREKIRNTREHLLKQYKSLARQLYASGMKSEARDIAKLAKQLEHSDYDTRIQRDYDISLEKLGQRKQQRKQTSGCQDYSTPIPKNIDKDEEIGR